MANLFFDLGVKFCIRLRLETCPARTRGHFGLPASQKACPMSLFPRFVHMRQALGGKFGEPRITVLLGAARWR
jgi:hypothetical protein